MAFELPPLPYAQDALEPHYSSRTLEFHHGKHHAAYVNNLNGLIDGTAHASKTLEEIVNATAGDASQTGVFNNAAQIWNHTFFWNSMKAGGGGAPTDDLATAIDNDFGSFTAFSEAFIKAATTRFGSGWGWLVRKDGKLQVISTPNAETPMTQGATPLLTVDVWEHAYYLDYQNRRPDFLQTFLKELVNWDFAAANLAKAG